MRLRNALAVLSIVICFLGCRSEAEKTVPDALIGVWKTPAASYEDNFLELRKHEILFGVGRSRFNVNRVFKVEAVRLLGEKSSLITIYYTDEEGKDNASTIHYDPTHPGTLRFRHQMQIEWKLVERRRAEQGGPWRNLPTGSWWTRSNLSMVVALLGVALTTGAALWRFRELRVEEAGATVENVGGAPAQLTEGGIESGPMGSASWGADWAQTPTSVPPVAAKEQRRSERILLKIPLHVAGYDVYGEAFQEQTFTISISRHGAFIWLKNLPRQGDPVAVTNIGTLQSCLFRLCESDKDPDGEFTAWGIECLEPSSNFWQIRFPEKPTEPSAEKNIAALIVCATCHSREVAELTVAEYHTMLEEESTKRNCPDCGATTDWKFILVEATTAAIPEETPAVSGPSGEEQRRERRIVAKLPIRLRHPEDDRIESTLTENVSKSGVCCAASMELNVDDVILLTFEFGTGPSEDENPARIMWRRPMGENRRILYGIRLEPKEL